MNRSKYLCLAIGIGILFGFACVSHSPKKEATSDEGSTGKFDLAAGKKEDVFLSSPKVKNGGLLVIHVLSDQEFAAKPMGVFEYRREGKDGKLEAKSLKLQFLKENPQSGTGYRALLGMDYDIELGEKKIQLTLPSGVKKEIRFTVVDGSYPSETLKVAQDKVVPPQKYEKRIVKEMKLLNEVYRQSTSSQLWMGKFGFPMDSKITSIYGGKRLYNGVKKNFHAGTDFKASEGTPLYAPAAGKVVLAQDLYFSGNTIIIDHGFGLFSIYMHLSKFAVHVGKSVKQGDQMGLSGKTGRVSGPHLHWGIQVQGVKVDPLELTREELMR